MAKKACHVVASATQVGLIQALGVVMHLSNLRNLKTSFILMFASCVVLSSCIKTVKPELSGGVDSSRLTPEESTRMRLSDNQIFIPGDQTNPELAPAYPVQLLPLRLPDQTICVSFTVNANGSVSDIKPIGDVQTCIPNDTHPEFMAATFAVVSQWDFFSSLRCTFPPGTPDEQKCNGPGATMEQVPVTLSYRFVFSSKGGIGAVQQARSGAHP